MTVIVLACAFLLLVPNTQGTKRYLIGDESVYDVLHRLENLVASLNTTFSQEIAGVQSSVQILQGSVHALQGSTQTLQSALQTETKQRCQSGYKYLSKIECSSTGCVKTLPIHFNPAFSGTPIIHYGVSHLDSEHGLNLRFDVLESSVTATSMTLTIKTWADTRLYGITGTKRYLIGDESVYDVLHRLENLVAFLNTTFSQDIAGQAGKAHFHKIECGSTSCSESVQVHFNPGFAGIPIVHYGVTLLDAEHGMNLRYDIAADSVTATSMTLTVNTWADTRLYGIWVSWMVCPP